MALKKCKECGNEVSSKAKKCPKCGGVICVHNEICYSCENFNED